MSLPTSFFVGQFSSGGSTYTTTFPMGHPDTGVANYSGGTAWFSAGYAGVDIGTNYQLSAGTDISQKRVQNRSTSNSNHSYWILIYEHTGGTIFTANQVFTVRGGWRMDSLSNSNGNTWNSPQLNTLTGFKVLSNSVFVVPSNTTYYLGWYSGSGGQGYGDGNALYVSSTSNNPSSYDPSTTTTTIQYKGTGVSLPSVGDAITMNQVAQATNMQLGLKA